MKRKFNKKTIIAVALLLVFGVIIVLSVLQNPVKQYTLEEYFEISAAIEQTGNDRFLANGTIIIIHSIMVKIKALQGDAHGVVVQSYSNSEPIYFGDIPKGTFKTDYMTFPSGTRITRSQDGQFLVTLRIYSQNPEIYGEVTRDIG